jgi:hypothetical protein
VPEMRPRLGPYINSTEVKTLMKMKKLGALLATACLVGAALAAAPITDAHAVGSSITGSATINSGASRKVEATWSGTGPFQVYVFCGTPGCSDYIGTNTTTTSVARWPGLYTCSATTKTHYVQVVDKRGDFSLSTTSTTWRAGSVC